MNSKSTISIIIPAYNEERHLGMCLEAIAAQTMRPYEVIVVDNASTDRTREVAESFPFVKVISESQRGLYHARQTGMRAAKGKILGRIDADTILDERWVEAVYNCYQDEDVVAATGPVGYYDMPFPRFAQKAEDALLRMAVLLRYRFLMGCNMTIRRSVWNQIADELCNEPFILEDIDIATHLMQRGLSPTYDSRIRALASARRLLDTPPNFLRYITGHTRTLAYHGESSAGAVYAEMAYVTTYILVRPLILTFDPDTRRLSLKRLRQKQCARPDPMAVGHTVIDRDTRGLVEYD